MEQFFAELLEYNSYANEQVTAACAKHREAISDKTKELFSHILDAHHLWNSRIEEVDPLFGVWQLHEIDTWKEIDSMNHERSKFIMTIFERDTIIPYVNSKGNPYENSVRDILFQIINHSTHHRAQIASDFRANGLEPVPGDYIFYKR